MSSFFAQIYLERNANITKNAGNEVILAGVLEISCMKRESRETETALPPKYDSNAISFNTYPALFNVCLFLEN